MNKTLLIVISALAIIAIVASVFLMTEPSEKETVSSETYSVGDLRITVTGDIVTGGNIGCEVNPESLIFSSEESAEWKVFDHDKPSSTSKALYKKYRGDTFSGTSITLDHPGYGSYDVTATVGDDVYSGTVTIDGKVERHYEWQCRDIDYSLDVSFRYSDYVGYQYKDVDRYASNRDRSVFVDGCGGLTDLIASSISAQTVGLSEYQRANVILAFVQECFDYPPHTESGSITVMSGDMYLTGHSDYTMYPIETMFYNAGDCEDTSILAASVFKAAGLKAALLMVPGHAMACVAIEGETDIGSYGNFEVYHANIDGSEYYVCETTTDEAVDVGLGSSDDFGSDKISSYMHKSEDKTSGMFII